MIVKSKSWLDTELPKKTNRMSESVFQKLLELHQAHCCGHCPGEPIPVPDHCLGEEPFPNSRPDPSLTAPCSSPRSCLCHQKAEVSAALPLPL